VTTREARRARARIRAARLEDAETVWHVHITSIRELCAGWYTEEEITVWTGRLEPGAYRRAIEAHVMVVAERDGDVVGFGELDLERGEVVAVYVLAAVAGRGVGADLLAHLEETARAAGFARLTLCASLNAEAFYARRGWRAGAREKHRLTPGVAVDCVRMDKALGA
jgi:N-acetylglutamate synthase-like GNAT family acetyltransferase